MSVPRRNASDKQDLSAQTPAALDHTARLAAGQACLDAALTVYLPRGFSITCCCDPDHIGVGRKHGQECRSPGKTPMHGWKLLQTYPPVVEEVLRRWRDFPYGNVGCVLGQVSGLVRVDVDGDAGEALLAQWSAGDLPPTWCFRSSAAGRGLLYAWPPDLPCKSTAQASPGDHKELRLMGNGSQTVLPPSRHASGSVYTWEPGSGPAALELAPAPAWLRARLCVDPRRQTPPSSDTAMPPDAACIGQAVRAIPNSGQSPAGYDDWLRIGMALHSTGEAWARELWEQWSAQSEKFDAAKQQKAWQSFAAAGAITVRTLFHLAKHAGWKPLRATLRVPDMTQSGSPVAEDAPDPAGEITPPAPNLVDGLHLPWSDYVNAVNLARDHGQDLRYCYPWGKWLVWDGTHWEHDQSGLVMRKAEQTVKRLARHAEHLDKIEMDALFRHIKSSLATAKLKAMVECAQSEPDIPVLPKAVDRDTWLLNCANGTLDLKTGVLHPHKRADLLTRCLDVRYEPKAQCSEWKAFLWKIFNQDKELILFLRRAIGYCLTGDVSEQCLFILWGSGANGKSTLVNTLLALLGTYVMKATAELLMVSRSDRHPTERADLFGKRLVAAIETTEGARLNEAFVKEATGGDPIRARRMREDFWQFDPTHKIILATNHKPVIRGTDHAIWRRIRLVPFTVTIPEKDQDKELPAKLMEELPGILAWAVRGCLDWQKQGLAAPDAVKDATQGYRDEMDVFEGFLAGECFRLPSAQVSAKDLYDAYERWCQANDVEALNKRAFGLRLADSGFTPDKSTGGVRIWRGIGLPNSKKDDKRSGA
jgi:P4 family phage/plasmid primase-like protien